MGLRLPILFAFLFIISLSQASLLDPLLKSPLVDKTFTFSTDPVTEVLIGFGVATPLSALKLFMPFACVRNGFELAFEGLDVYVYYNQMLTQDSYKNA